MRVRQLTREEAAWARQRVACLQQMIRSLDEDLPALASTPCWAAFWSAMRRLYSRTLLSLQTGVATGDRQALDSGRLLWREIQDRLDLADRDLAAAPVADPA